MALHHARVAALGILSFLGLSAGAEASYSETWNDPGAGANRWYYFQAGAPDNGDVPLAWTASGGVDPAPSGFVSADLGAATTWTPTGAGNYFLAYTYRSHHPLDLTLAPWAEIALKDGGGLDLGGGTLRFWIGDFDDPNGPNPPAATYSFFYLDLPLAYGTAGWVTNSIDTTAYSWVQFANQNGRPVGDLLSDPQQWGIGLFGAADTPGGTLALDNFIPSPAPLALIALGLAGLGWTRRRAPLALTAAA